MNKGKVYCKSPFVITIEPGKYSWCSCGYSSKEPYCDGSHKSAETECKPVREVVTETKKVAWCGCKQTNTPPFCDGSHKCL